MTGYNIASLPGAGAAGGFSKVYATAPQGMPLCKAMQKDIAQDYIRRTVESLLNQYHSCSNPSKKALMATGFTK